MITRFALKNNVLTIAVLFVMVLGGLSVFQAMPRDDMPPFLIRNVNIVTSYPGASPVRVENLISDKIEKVVQEIPEVDYISSESRTGISIVTVALKESEFNLQPIFDRIRRKVEEVESQLPEGSQVTIEDELGDVFGIILGVTAQGYSFSEIKDIADDIRNELIKLPDAAKVEITGIQEERIYIEFDDARLSELGLTKEHVSDIISKINIIIPGGELRAGDRRIILEPTGSFESVDDLRQVIVSIADNKLIRLGDVTNITRGYLTPRNSIVNINGVTGLAIGVNLKKGGNIILLGRQVDEKLKELMESYPYGVEIERVASQDAVVETSVNGFIMNLIQAIVVVLIVMLMFLGLRTGMVVASLIPATMVMTILIMSILGVGLNKVTLAALIIALGMLVDNAIVMSESIMVKMEGGTKAFDAAIESSRELVISLLTSSLTTSAAFMAFFLAESVLGEIMGNIFIVVTIALISSWILTLSLITLLCVSAIKVNKKKGSEATKPGLFDKLSVYYRRFLVFNLKHPVLTISVVLIMFVTSLFLMKFIPFIFMPKSDRAVVTLNLELPVGTAIEKTETMVQKVEAYMKANLLSLTGKTEGVVSWSSYVGEGAPKYDLGYTAPESSPNAAHILINTSSDPANDLVIGLLDEFIFNNFPDVVYSVSRLISGGGSADPIVIRISGDDETKLYELSEKIKIKLSSIAGAKNISDDWGLKTKKLVVDINQTNAQIAGVSNQDIAVSLQTVLSGSQTGSYREDDKVIPIMMRNDNADTLTIEELEGMNIYVQNSGKSVPLKQVAEIIVKWQPTKILRRDLTRTLSVTSDVQPGVTASEVMNQLSPWLKNESQNWAQGYTYEIGGDAEGSSDAMGAIIKKLPLSVLIIILLLVAQFNSIKKPTIILLTIPLGLIGVILGLLITGSYFGFMAFLGLISLAGIVINNAIVLLDRIEFEETENNKQPQDSVVDAALQRFRPILLTTATTAFGLIPLWIGGGLLWEPMAIGIIFGLLFATGLTLIIVPVLYRVFFGISYADYS